MTSGYGALQLAALKGARAITLFGFDYGPSPDGEWHYNESRYTRKLPQYAGKWAVFASVFDRAVPVLRDAGVKVLNASPNSAITAFPRSTLQQAINDPDLRGL